MEALRVLLAVLKRLILPIGLLLSTVITTPGLFTSVLESLTPTVSTFPSEFVQLELFNNNKLECLKLKV